MLFQDFENRIRQICLGTELDVIPGIARIFAEEIICPKTTGVNSVGRKVVR
jgi:hypothetical protein